MTTNDSNEKRIIYQEGDNVRCLRGTIYKEDETFFYVHRNDGDQRLSKKFVIRIEEGNHE